MTKPLFSKYRRSTLVRHIKYVKDPEEQIELVTWIAGRTRDKIILRDPSGLAEVKLSGVLAGEIYRLPRETLIWLKATIHSDYLNVIDYRVIHKPTASLGVDYTKLPRDLDELARHYAWYMRNPIIKSTIQLLDIVTRRSREFLYSEGFIEILPPMIGPVSDPGLRGARKLKTIYYGEEYELTSSVIMYKQATAAVYEKVFFTARNIREEPVENIKTGRHLSEFTQLDMEWALSDIWDVIDLAERLLHHVTKYIADKHYDLIHEIGKRKEPIILKPPFPKLTYDEALKLAERLGEHVEWGKELSHDAETKIAEYYDSPIWVIGYPVISRGFYYLPNPEDPRYNLDFNLLLPEGYGEVIDGGTREYRYEKLIERIKLTGEPLEKYSWFLELAAGGGIPPSSGWGLGLERLTRYIAGHKHVGYASPFPKLPGITRTP